MECFIHLCSSTHFGQLEFTCAEKVRANPITDDFICLFSFHRTKEFTHSTCSQQLCKGLFLLDFISFELNKDCNPCSINSRSYRTILETSNLSVHQQSFLVIVNEGIIAFSPKRQNLVIGICYINCFLNDMWRCSHLLIFMQ